jgi:hypothetical protein
MGQYTSLVSLSANEMKRLTNAAMCTRTSTTAVKLAYVNFFSAGFADNYPPDACQPSVMEQALQKTAEKTASQSLG